MKELPLLLIFLAFALIFGGCTTDKLPEPAHNSSCHFLDNDALRQIAVQKVIEGMNGELMTSQIILRSRRSSTKVFIRAKYYDSLGKEIPSTFNQWKWLSVVPRTDSSFSAVAPNPEVSKIVFEIRSASTKASVSPAR